MKILLFSPVPMPEMCQEANLDLPVGGGWVYSMLRELKSCRDLHLSVAWASRDCRSMRMFERDGVHYWTIPDPGWLASGGGFFRRICNQFEPFLGTLRDRRAVATAVALVKACNPDVVHVFGSEHRHGLIAPHVQVPVIIWLQGIKDVIAAFYFGTMPFLERLLHPRIILEYCRLRAEAARERRIYEHSRYFFGRTGWDRAHQLRLQPNGRYYLANECLRLEFYAAHPWCIERSEPFRIYTTTNNSLYKGTDVLIRATALLRRSYSQIKLLIGGISGQRSPVGPRLLNLIRKLHLEENVILLGELSPDRVIEELTLARTFVMPSFIENSPNSLAEAQLVGTPVVASYVGGVCDLIEHGQTGLLFQSGDYASLALQIERIISHAELARRLSEAGRKAATERHDRSTILEAVLAGYRAVLADWPRCSCENFSSV